MPGSASEIDARTLEKTEIGERKRARQAGRPLTFGFSIYRIAVGGALVGPVIATVQRPLRECLLYLFCKS